MSNLELLAGQRTMIVIDSATLLTYLREDREQTFLEGVRAGRRLEDQARNVQLQAPLTKKEAALALGFSEGTIDNMRRRGELESYEYGGQVRINRSEIERFKRTHANLYTHNYQLKPTKK